MKVRFVSLDLDGTIVNRDYVDYFWLELVPTLYSERHGLNLEDAKREVQRQYDEIGPKDLRWYNPEYWFQRFGLDSGMLSWALEEAGRFVKPYRDALEFIEAVKGEVQLVLSTSASREFIKLVFARVPELEQAFAHVFSSTSDFSLPGKPPEFYKAILKQLGAEPSEIIHAGDDEEADYRIPASLGIRAFLVDRNGVKGISSLLELLEEIELAQ
jgi:putative hydrolase of the HAD superfamily